MKKEVYVWVVFFVVIVAVASYFRFFYQPALSMSVSMRAAPGNIYPYQIVQVPITVVNTGSVPISNMAFGTYLNKNISTVYKASIPAGKQATVYFNFTPSSAGIYNITFIADPSKIYNIAGRASAQKSMEVTVLNAERASPFEYFTVNGITGEDRFNMTPEGYLIGKELYYNYSVGVLTLTGSRSVDHFFYPAFAVYGSYIDDIAVSHAYYDNYSLADVWIKGYLNANAIEEAAVGQGLNVSSYNSSVYVINFGNRTTLCSFYAGGWLQNFISINGNSCASYLKNRNAFNYTGNYGLLKTTNGSVLNYTGYQGRIGYAGSIAAGINNSILFESVVKGGNYTNKCYGNILNISNVSYCSTDYMFGNNDVLSENERLVGNYSIGVWSMSSIAAMQPANYQALAVAGSYNLSGAKIGFVSAFTKATSMCSLGAGATCLNPVLSGGNMTFTITNNFNDTLTLDYGICYEQGPAPSTHLNITIAPGESKNVTVGCYNKGQALSGIELYIMTYVNVGYVRAGKSGEFRGYAYIT